MHHLDAELRALRSRLDATTARLDTTAAELAATQQRLAAAEHTLARAQPPRRRRTGRSRLGAALALAVLLALVPLSLVAAGPFTDLVPNSPHNNDINAIANAGITTGCVPGAAYCPDRNVTRQEMASFLARTAGLGGNPPVANALTAVNAQNAVTAASATNATNATNAQNANTVGGYAPNALVRVASNDYYVAYLSTNYTTTGSVTITVPGPGFVLVFGSVSPEDHSTSPVALTMTRLRDTAPGGETSTNQYASGGQYSTYGRSFTVSTNWVFPVKAAGTKTYVLEIRLAAVGNDITKAYNGQLTALYVPFGSTGAGTLGADEPAPASPAAPERP